MKKMNCPICNNKIQLADIKGHVFPWKDFSQVRLLVSFETLSCSGCGEVLLQGRDSMTLDSALEESVRIQAANFLLKVKDESRLTQKALAKKIGISEVYLSEIISKKKTVSSQIFNFLKIMANHPETLADLEAFTGKCGYQTQMNIESDAINKFKYLGEDRIIELQGQRRFERMLGNDVREGAH